MCLNVFQSVVTFYLGVSLPFLKQKPNYMHYVLGDRFLILWARTIENPRRDDQKATAAAYIYGWLIEVLFTVFYLQLKKRFD